MQSRLRADSLKLGFATACATLLTACGSSPNTNDSGQPKTLTGAEVRNRLASTDNGLELRRWTVVDQPGQLGATLAKHVSGAAIDEPTQLRLKRNGWRIVRVNVNDLDALERDLGGATVNASEWHGQAVDWRSLQDHQIDSRGLAIALDGKVERFDRGDFRLMIRSWTVQTEDGPVVHLELVPRHHLPSTNRFRQALGQGGDTDAGFAAMALDMQLEDGFAYVLVSESPQTEWPGIDATDPTGTGPKPPRRATRTGPSDSIGPDVAPPRTLGELLLPTVGTPATRSVLVFVPKIASALWPPDLLAAREVSSREAAPSTESNPEPANSAPDGDGR